VAQSPVKFELSVNLIAAKTLGLRSRSWLPRSRWLEVCRVMSKAASARWFDPPN
jgi:hypothetical protein